MKFEFILSLFLFSPSLVLKDRKLMFTPYLNDFEQYGAQPVGSESDFSQKSMAAVPVGESNELRSSLIPGGFSGSFNQPGTYTTPLSHLGITT